MFTNVVYMYTTLVGMAKVDILAIIVMKLAVKRERPPHHQADGRFVGPDQHSFPSGHATRVWCVVGLILNLSKCTLSVVTCFR